MRPSKRGARCNAGMELPPCSISGGSLQPAAKTRAAALLGPLDPARVRVAGSALTLQWERRALRTSWKQRRRTVVGGRPKRFEEATMRWNLK